MEKVSSISLIPNPGGRRKAGKKKKTKPKTKSNPLQHRRQNSSLRNAALPARPARTPGRRQARGGDDTGGTEFFSKGRKIPLSFFSSSARGGCLYRRLVWLQWQAYIPRNDSFQHLRTTTSCRKPTVLQVRPVTHFPDNRPS